MVKAQDKKVKKKLTKLKTNKVIKAKTLNSPIKPKTMKIKKKLRKTNQNAEEIQVKAKLTPKTEESKPKKARAMDQMGLLYLGHLPYGFFEEEIKGYFSQFGKVLKVILPRSKKNMTYRGYGFVIFEYDEIAKIAAEAMDNYLMFGKRIVAEHKPNSTEQISKLLKAPSIKTLEENVQKRKLANCGRLNKPTLRSNLILKTLKSLKIVRDKLKKVGLNWTLQPFDLPKQYFD